LHGYDIYRGLKIIDHTTKCKPEDDPLESGVISKNNSEMQSLRDEIAELKKLLADANKEIADLKSQKESQKEVEYMVVKPKKSVVKSNIVSDKSIDKFIEDIELDDELKQMLTLRSKKK
jgi:hypothetical protein